MSKRNLRLENFGISKKRYKELCGFCEQYPEWKSQIREYTLISSPKYSDMPKPSGNSDTTADLAIRLTNLKEKCEIIEKSAKEASDDLWEYIIRSACYEESVNMLISLRGMPLEKSAFYEMRRYFFYVLDRNKRY